MSDQELRKKLIRVAFEHPETREKLLPLLNKEAKTTLRCEMEKGCKKPVTHIDNKGYIYCTDHAARRKAGGVPTRKLRPAEIKKLEQGGTADHY